MAGAGLSSNFPLLGTDNVHRQVSTHIFAPNGDYCLFMSLLKNLLNIFHF